MKSKYEFKVVKSKANLATNIPIDFYGRINDQIAEEGENGWDYYKTVGMYALVFRRPRQPDKSA